MAKPKDVVLDTNILVHLTRGSATGLAIQEGIERELGVHEVLACRVSHGELILMARNRGWEHEKLQRLHDLLGSIAVVELRSDQVLQAYAEVRHHCQKVLKPARDNKGNDAWIAAAARAIKGTVATTDEWFDCIGGSILDVIRFSADDGSLIVRLPYDYPDRG